MITMKKKTKRIINENLKRYGPIAITIIFLSSMLIGFDRADTEGVEDQQKVSAITAFFVLNVSGQKPSGGQIIVEDNSTVLDFFNDYGFQMRLDKRSDDSTRIVCMSNLCNSLNGNKWRVFLNGNESNVSIDNYTIDYGDVIELRYY